MFTLVATGTAPLQYQWQVSVGGSWSNVGTGTGATTATFTTAATSPADSGSQFRVMVSNSAGSVTSTAATLTVLSAPSITVQPASATVNAPAPATFVVAATGTAPLAYQWQANTGGVWANVTSGSGGTTPAYTTGATAGTSSGSQFRVVVTNSVGTATSNAATLTVVTPPTITSQPASTFVTAPAPATFSIAASGPAPLEFQWQVNPGSGWVDVSTGSGGTSATYTTAATSASDHNRQFRARVSNPAGSVTSQTAVLTVGAAPQISVQPQSAWATATGTATFSVAATGSAPLTYQWRKNGSAIAGATLASYTTPATSIGDNGASFTVVVTNAIGSATSNAAGLTVASLQNPAPDSQRERWTPTVIPEDYTGLVNYEVTVGGTPAWMVLQIDGIDRPMFNDGTHGDALAGDSVWTLQLPASEILAKHTPDSYFRPFLGFCKLGGAASRYNVFPEVWTASLGAPLLHSLDASGQETDYVANYVATGAQIVNFDPKPWAQRFYQAHGDTFDFLNFVMVAGKRGNRYHASVRNSVAGIGLAPLNLGSQFGSAARLKGYTVFPVASLFDLGAPTFSHELGHQWINFLSGTPYASGIAHWPKGDIATNLMGFSLPDGAGGQFSYAFTPNGSGGYTVGAASPLALSTFNTMELYLMGMAAPAEVGTYFILKDQNQVLASGQTLTAAQVTLVTLPQIISVVGPRAPDHATAQRDFRCATIVLSEQLLDARSMALYDWCTRRAEAQQVQPFSEGFTKGNANPWFLATGGRSTMTSKIR